MFHPDVGGIEKRMNKPANGQTLMLHCYTKQGPSFYSYSVSHKEPSVRCDVHVGHR